MASLHTPLTLSQLVLRLLLIANFVYGGAIVAGLVASFAAEVSFMTALGIPPSPETEPQIRAMRLIAVLGLLAVPLYYVMLKRLLAIVDSVRAGDPFVAANAARLTTIAWALLGVQLLSLAISFIARGVSTEAHPLELSAGFSTGAWLAVVLLFVLARVFAEGTRMRDDLAGTV
ncbi:MAG TPA: DUF2975 domain-containing protein [Croceibacterium sp.]|nr:DUF2975 domain-containing protein [Croceibacterium sp.]